MVVSSLTRSRAFELGWGSKKYAATLDKHAYRRDLGSPAASLSDVTITNHHKLLCSRCVFDHGISRDLEPVGNEVPTPRRLFKSLRSAVRHGTRSSETRTALLTDLTSLEGLGYPDIISLSTLMANLRTRLVAAFSAA